MTIVSRPVVLVIDSDPLSLTATSAVLHCCEFEVHGVASRESALRAAHALRLDLVICDLDVAGVEGYALADELRRVPERADVPVMFASSCQQPEVIRKCHSQGSAYHLRKPFDPKVLLELVEAAVWLPHLVRSHVPSPHIRLTPAIAPAPAVF